VGQKDKNSKSQRVVSCAARGMGWQETRKRWAGKGKSEKCVDVGDFKVRMQGPVLLVGRKRQTSKKRELGTRCMPVRVGGTCLINIKEGTSERGRKDN